MKTFKVLLERLKSREETFHHFKSLGYNDEDAWGMGDRRDDRVTALKKSLRDPSRSAEQHGQAVRILRRLGDTEYLHSSWDEDGHIPRININSRGPEYTPKQMAAREASKRRRQPKSSYIKTKSPPLLTGRTINVPK